LDVRYTEGLRQYVNHQPEMAREFSERVKNDAERLINATQTFIENARKVHPGKRQPDPEGHGRRRPGRPVVSIRKLVRLAVDGSHGPPCGQRGSGNSG